MSVLVSVLVSAPHRLGGPPWDLVFQINDLKIFLTYGLWGDTLKPQPRWEVPTFAGIKWNSCHCLLLPGHTLPGQFVGHFSLLIFGSMQTSETGET